MSGQRKIVDLNMAEPNILEMRRIYKKFGTTVALDHVDLNLKKGEVHALLGMNGAGKSTLMKVLSGLYRKDSGDIEIDGRAVEIDSPQSAMRNGIASVQQHPQLVSSLSGYDNIFLGHEGARPGLFRRVSRKDIRRRADELVARYSIPIDLDREVAAMSSVERELVAILQALSRENGKILILDEPTSTLTEQEKDHLFNIMNTIKRSGVAIVYITHRLDEVFEICDRLTIFRNGRNVLTMDVADAPRDKSFLAEKLLGEPVSELYPPKASDTGANPTVLELEGLCGKTVANVSLTARKGQIVGIFGLVGSGGDELAKLIFGARPIRSGEMTYKGRRQRFSTTTQALANGIYLLPGDRLSEGLILDQDVVFNMTLANLKKASDFLGLKRRRANRRAGSELASVVGLQPPVLDRLSANFSGGNQQKILVGRGLFRDADLYIFVEPTVGVDVGARSTIYKLIRSLANDAAVILISSDSDEVFGLADEMFALCKGEQSSVQTAEISREQLLLDGILKKTAETHGENA